MQGNQLASHDPALSGDPERIPEIGKQADSTGNQGCSQDQDLSKEQDPNDRVGARSPVRLPARARENAIRYRRCLDPDCW